MEVLLDNGNLSNDAKDVLQKWEREFSSLLNLPNTDVPESINSESVIDTDLDRYISILEVKKAIDNAKRGKAFGIDRIPVDVLKNDTSVMFLHVLFNVCFNTGTIPSLWGKNVICPIPKSSTADPRDPLSYRGISLASSMYKLYSCIINTRLTIWAETNNKFVDEQNGFRKKRSTIDHVSSITNIVDTRKKSKLSTFCAFIDFRKAYDCIDRNKLWNRLDSIGVSSKMLTAVKSLYRTISSCVRVNHLTTGWFSVKSGLRQGCSLSPLLFNLFVNDLTLRIKSLGKGVYINDEHISLLLYADDLVLIAENEEDLQHMLHELGDWCSANSMHINTTKSNVVHFRPPSVQQTDYTFTCGDDTIDKVDRYAYLGLTLSEHLDYNVMVKVVAQSASRALGLLIAKYKCLGGMPYDVFTKLYWSIVYPVISYGAAVWGFRGYSCINAVQNRAMRVFLGTGRYTPTAAVSGDMGWIPSNITQWKSICCHWSRQVNMGDDRVNKRIFTWAYSKANRSCRNWTYAVMDKFKSIGRERYCDISTFIQKNKCVDDIHISLMDIYVSDWSDCLNRVGSNSGNGRNKLRTYRLFKSNFEVERYCKIILPLQHRSAFARFRCGVAPLRIETGRYENISESDRLCIFCHQQQIETESHVILECTEYNTIRENLIDAACRVNPLFMTFTDAEKMKFVFSNTEMIRVSAKTCFHILQRRNAVLYK